METEGDMCVECEANIPAHLDISTINASILWTKTHFLSLKFLHIKAEIFEVELSFSFISSFIVYYYV